MSQFYSDIVHKLTPYVPGEQPQNREYLKLNTNENPYPPSAKVDAALKNHPADLLRRYPDPNSAELINAIANNYGIESNQVFVGNGSDEVLAHAFHAFFTDKEQILFPDITYSFYPVYANLYQIDAKQVPVNNDFSIDLDQFSQPNGGVILPNPNAPTGRYLELDQIEVILKNNPKSVVIIDEAYIDFGGQSAVSLINLYNNLLVIQTFSKSRSLFLQKR